MTRTAHLKDARIALESALEDASRSTSRQLLGLYADAATARHPRRPQPGHVALRAVFAGL